MDRRMHRIVLLRLHGKLEVKSPCHMSDKGVRTSKLFFVIRLYNHRMDVRVVSSVCGSPLEPLVFEVKACPEDARSM